LNARWAGEVPPLTVAQKADSPRGLA
jgi:hypothetical protein